MATRMIYLWTVLTVFCVTLSVVACPPPPPCITPGAFNLISPEDNAPDLPTDSVTLSWSVSNYVDTYYVFLEASDPTPDTFRGTTSNTSWAVPSGLLQPGTTYYWRIRATNCGPSCSPCGTRWSTQTWSFTTVDGSPDPVTLTVNSTGEGSVAVSLPGTSPYTCDFETTVDLRVSPLLGYHFVR